jgi:hypothetical protein
MMWRYDPAEHTLNLEFEWRGQRCEVQIQQRNHYCDRGHYLVLIDGPFNFDAADLRPNYYMSLEAAITETEKFLEWRINKVSEEPRMMAMMMLYDNRNSTFQGPQEGA